MYIVKRSEHNPIINPSTEHGWASYATFNWCPILDDQKRVHVVYRAMTQPDLLLDGPRFSISTIGYAWSDDEQHFHEHKEFIYPEYPWEKFGCEDPRVTRIDDTYYIFYTALSEYPFRAEGIKVAVATTRDFKTLDSKSLVTPFNAKAMTFFPNRVNGKLTALFTVNPDRPPAHLAIVQFDTVEDLTNPEFWSLWYARTDGMKLLLNRDEGDHCEVGAPPIWTEYGWLVIYSHIQNYFDESKRVFGIEAVLLDHQDVSKIIGRTRGPVLVPEEPYERVGQIPDITFPSGALLEGDDLHIYYGGADTNSCMASVNVEHLIASMLPHERRELVQRYENNPILKPIRDHQFEEKLVFNPTTVDVGDTTYIIYRAMSDDNTSSMGGAITRDGVTIDERFAEPIYVPRAPFEQKKGDPHGNSGCEDGRATVIGNTIYLFYTAYDGIHTPQVAMSTISVEDFTNRQWEKWSYPILVTPDNIDDKDACLMAEKINNEYWVMHRIKHHVCLDTVPELDFAIHRLNRCIPLIGPRFGMWDGLKVGIAGPPLRTDKGWLLLYHGVSDDKYYRVGAMLLELDNPSNIIGRTADFVLEPEESWELYGEINKVVFPCGATIRDEHIYIYYGGADTVVGVATARLDWLLDVLTWKQGNDNWY